MFSKLRNKLLILIMAVTSFVLISAFVVVYTITYQNMQTKNAEKLNASTLGSFFPNLRGLPEDFTDILSPLLVPSDYSLSFTLLIDEAGMLVEKYSLVDMPTEDYIEAAQKAWEKPSNNDPIRLNGRMWQYAVSHQALYTIRSGQSVRSLEGYMVSFLDVTESHQTLQALLFTFIVVGIGTLIAVFAISLFFANHAVKPIKTAWEAQRQFIADASHELKTPLTIINSNYGALISKKHETIESQMKWLNYIKGGADRMDKLVADLLYLTKTDAAEANPKPAPVNVGDIISGEMRAMEAVASGKGLTIVRDIEPDTIVSGNSEKLAQVIRILFDNAIRYANENGEISIALKQERHHAVFSIQNTGEGIKKEHLPKIFDRFYRADASRAHDGGYGLGLSIARAILENMGGEIHAASEEGKSATFVVVLPMNKR